MKRSHVYGPLAAILAMATSVACVTEVELHGNSGSSGSGGSGASGSTGPGGTCSAYLDEDGLTTVTVRIVNLSDRSIFLTTSCGQLMPQIEPLAGPDGTAYVFDRSCLSTCETLQTSEPLACTAEACALTVIEVLPNETFETAWEGTGLTQTEMPASCWYDPTYSSDSCSQIVSAEPGDYRVNLQAYDTCTDCFCDEYGTCYGEAGGNEAFQDVAKLSYPADDVVEVVFGVCAFGCAD